MLKKLHIKNLGPAEEFELDLGDRLNLITGDNGLGKSFILDVAWWVLTKKWPAEINSSLAQGLKIIPEANKSGSIDGMYISPNKAAIQYSYKFERKYHVWKIPKGRPWNAGLVLYAMPDGSFAAWDSARNYWKKETEDFERAPAFVFTPREIMHGLYDENKKILCKGLIDDIVIWKSRNPESLSNLNEALQLLSPGGDTFSIGEIVKSPEPFSLQEIPTITSQSLGEIPVIYASSAIKRVLSLAYLIIWAWEQNHETSVKLEIPPAKQITLLIDEPEVHLHPKWQRSFLRSLVEIMNAISDGTHGVGQKKPSIQIIAATHSPLITASAEGFFNSKHDAWFDIDISAKKEKRDIQITKREFHKEGSVSAWLTSDAFDLPTDFSPDIELVYLDAKAYIEGGKYTSSQTKLLTKKLEAVLPDRHYFLNQWRKFASEND